MDTYQRAPDVFAAHGYDAMEVVLKAVEIAHPAAVCEPAVILGDVTPAAVTRDRTPDFTAQQTYLYAPPLGLDAPAAWAVNGGILVFIGGPDDGLGAIDSNDRLFAELKYSF